MALKNVTVFYWEVTLNYFLFW